MSGTFSYTVTITDSKGNKGTLNCSVTVSAPPISICTRDYHRGAGGGDHSSNAECERRVGAPYTFTARGLPTGLSISTGRTISGTPTVNGTFVYMTSP